MKELIGQIRIQQEEKKKDILDDAERSTEQKEKDGGRGGERKDWRERDVEIGGGALAVGLQGPGCLRRGRKDV